MIERRSGTAALVGSCAAIFWPGAFIFGFPGVMGPHWRNILGVQQAAVGRTLFFVLAAVGIFMFLTGRWQEKIGPRWLAGLGAVLCGLSTIMVGHASGIGTVYLWAFLVGISSSFIYIPTLTVAQRWFPSRRGLVSGLVNMAFGLSAGIMSPVFSHLMVLFGYTQTTLGLGVAALFIGLAATPFVRLPEAEQGALSGRPSSSMGLEVSLNVSQSLRTRNFWFLWFTWALAGAAGIAMVTLSTAFGLAKGLTIQGAVVILTAFNVTNGLSRLVSGYLSDLFGRNVTMATAFLCAGCAYFLLPILEGLALWAVLAAAVGFAFGTLFAVSAPLVGDCFGMKHFGAIFGLIFTAYGFVAGAIGPWLSGHLLDATRGNFQTVFMYLGGFYFISTVLIWFARPAKVKHPGP